MSIPIPAETPDPNIDEPTVPPIQPTPPTEPAPVPEQEPPGTNPPPREEPPTVQPPEIVHPCRSSRSYGGRSFSSWRTTTGITPRITNASNVLSTAVASRPIPAETPMAAVIHKPAAVVRPLT